MAGLTAAVAIVWTGINVGDYRSRRILPATSPHQIVVDWRTYAERGERIGDSTAATTVTVFSDYQCPACAEMAVILDRMMQHYPAQLAVVVRHLPLPTHPNAAAAAAAAICASVQDRFQTVHRRLFRAADSLGIDHSAWLRFAAASSLPSPERFATCITDGATTERLRADLRDADRLGVFATPGFLVQDRLYIGLPWDLDAILARAVAEGGGGPLP